MSRCRGWLHIAPSSATTDGMAETNKKPPVATETYFADLGRVYASGCATGERSSYGPLHGLLNAVGAALRPKVHCVQEPADQGAGHPDFALYAARQMQKSRVVKRAFTPTERAATGDTLPALGDMTFDIYLNGEAFWHNVPAAVWTYRLDGYQVLKKWLSYRERAVLGLPLVSGEDQHFADTARRTASILLLAGAGRGQSDPGGP